MVIITLDIFSGRPNPKWVLTELQVKELKEKLYSLREKSFIKTTIYILGYRGFIISSAGDPDLSTEILVKANLVDFGRTRESYIDTEHNIENWLLETSGNLLDEKLKNYIQKEIAKEKNNIDFYLNKENFSADFLTEPPYNAGLWNNDKCIRINNNCYNYCCNIQTHTRAQPGRGSGSIYNINNPVCNEVGPASIRDGLISIKNISTPPADGHYVALAIAPDVVYIDYHFYRRDSNGYWSHKIGGTNVINYDSSKRLINDPATADRNPYTVFCGYYHVIPGSIRIL